MHEFSKSERQQLRDLAERVYEVEAHRLLEELDAEFTRWRSKDCSSWDLIEAIHKFHQHKARDLWSTYRVLDPDDLVARGIAFGFIGAEALPAPIHEKLQRSIAGYSYRRDDAP